MPLISPFAAGAQIRLDVGYLESAFGAPPFHSLIGIGQGLKDPFRRGFYGDFLNDGVAWAGEIHWFFST